MSTKYGYDVPLSNEIRDGAAAASVGIAGFYTLFELNRDIDPDGLDRMWEHISPVYARMPEGVSSGLPMLIEHAKHVGELALSVGPAAAGFFAAINLSDRSLIELGQQRYGRAAMLFAGSLACYAVAGGWRPGLQLAVDVVTKHANMVHDPQALTVLGTAAIAAGFGAALNIGRDTIAGLALAARHVILRNRGKTLYTQL